MKNGAVLRFITICVVSVCVIFYNLFTNLDFKAVTNEPQKILNTSYAPSIKFENKKNEETNHQTQNNESKQNNSSTENKNNSSVAVSAGAIKGKIETRYISPYNSSTVYDKVYLKNNTSLKIDIKSLLEESLKFKIEKNKGPQVLILHTHATEAFFIENTDYYTEKYNSRSQNNEINMVKIGEVITKKLNDAGIETIHDKTLHDYPNYSGSYSRAAETITKYLKKYPSIKVVLDLHRDAVTAENGDKVKLVTKINGKQAAQVMLVMGSQSGTVTNFPNWKENLKLAVRLQQKIEQKYPTLARPLTLNSKNYNESLTTGSLLLEFGTDVNTLDEALYSADLVGNSLIELLNELK